MPKQLFSVFSRVYSIYLSIADFLPALRKLFGNPIFVVFMFLTILQYNSLVGIITYETKFMEQQFNVSVAKAIFLIGRYLTSFQIPVSKRKILFVILPSVLEGAHLNFFCLKSM